MSDDNVNNNQRKNMNMIKISKKMKEYMGDVDMPDVSAPLIDKLSGVVDVKDAGLHGLAYSTALGWIEAHEVGIEKASGSFKYPLAIRIYYAPDGGIVHKNCPFILLQFTSKKASYRQMRLEWNPAHMTAAAMPDIDARCMMLVGMTFYELLGHARFTRVDFCRNIADRDIEDYLIRSKWSKVSQCFFNNDGKLETINLGKSGNNQIIAYDKTKEQHGKAADHKMIRIEARCRINLTLHGLMKFKNPPFGDAHWLAFQDSCRLRGVGNAIKKQPVKCQTALKKVLSTLPVTWWAIEDGDSVNAWNWYLMMALKAAGLLNIPDAPPPLTLANGMGEAA